MANCTSLDIIGEIQLEIKVGRQKTLISADVASNLVADLILGHDWLKQNNAIIDVPNQQLTLINPTGQNTVTHFTQPPHLQFPVLLIDQITLSPHSETWVDVTVPSLFGQKTGMLFEPKIELRNKALFAASAL
ncbi:unnamed protein product, partial [Didymodactylos carnosus]